MKPTLGILIALSTLALVAGLPGAGEVEDRPRPHDTAEAAPATPRSLASAKRGRLPRDCKPRAPLDAALWTTSVAGGRLDARFSVESRSVFDEVRWHLELPDGATLRSGAGAGIASGERGDATLGAFGVELPAGVQRSEVTLVVTGTFDGPNGAASESLEVRRSLGPSAFEAVPRRHVVRGIAGSSGALAVLPTAPREDS